MPLGHGPISSVPIAALPEVGGLKLASVTFVGTGTLTATAVKVIAASATFTGRGALGISGALVIKTATASFNGGSTLTATPTKIGSATPEVGGGRGQPIVIRT